MLANLQQHNILKFGGGQAAPLPGTGGHRAPALLALARLARGALKGWKLRFNRETYLARSEKYTI